MNPADGVYRLVPGGGNGSHFCSEKGTISRLSDDIAELKTMISHLIRETKEGREDLADVKADIAVLSAKVGESSADPTIPGSGLTGAVVRIANKQIEQDRTINHSVRPRLDSLEIEGEVTAIQSREDLLARVRVAESRNDKMAAKQWSLFSKIVLGIVTGGSLAGLAKALFEVFK